MVVVNVGAEGIGIQIRKKLGRSSEYGQKIYGSHEYGEQETRHGIYQVRTRYGHQVVVREKFYIPKNPQTGIQQANRNKFIAGGVAWLNLTDSEKAVYNGRAKYKQYTGYNLYIREYMLSN